MFPFYSQDFIMGTVFMSNEQVGIYIRLLCSQHQHGGIIDKETFEGLVGNNRIIRSKFVETDDGFFNERLMIEMDKRKIKSSNLSANAKQMWEKRKQMQYKSNANAEQSESPLKYEDCNMKDEIRNMKSKGGLGEKKNRAGATRPRTTKFIVDPFGGGLLKWGNWKRYKRDEHRFTYRSAESENQALQKLFELSGGNVDTATKIIEQSIGNGWQGLFPLKNQINGNHKKDSTGVQLEKGDDQYDKMK